MQIHPSVILNISDHFTRILVQERELQRVIGALLGKVHGRTLEIIDSFELAFSIGIDDMPTLDLEYYSKKEALVRQTCPDLEFVGWYSTNETSCRETDSRDLHLHAQISTVIENPTFIKLDQDFRTGISISGVLPIRVFETVIDIVNNSVPTTVFVEIAWTMVTEEAEMIVLEHNAKITRTTPTKLSGTNSSGASSSAMESLEVQYNAHKMLRDRVKLIVEYVKDVQKGKLERNDDILISIDKLCKRFPVLDSSEYTHSYHNQCNDMALHAYLGIITKSSNTMNQFENKYNVLHSRHLIGGRSKGPFF